MEVVQRRMEFRVAAALLLPQVARLLLLVQLRLVLLPRAAVVVDEVVVAVLLPQSSCIARNRLDASLT